MAITGKDRWGWAVGVSAHLLLWECSLAAGKYHPSSWLDGLPTLGQLAQIKCHANQLQHITTIQVNYQCFQHFLLPHKMRDFYTEKNCCIHSILVHQFSKKISIAKQIQFGEGHKAKCFIWFLKSNTHHLGASIPHQCGQYEPITVDVRYQAIQRDSIRNSIF